MSRILVIFGQLYIRSRQCVICSSDRGKARMGSLFSVSIYCLALASEHYRQVYIVYSGLQDESLQGTISKLP